MRLLDVLPAALQLSAPGSVSVTPPAGVTNNSTPTMVDVTIATVPLGGTVTIDYAATLQGTVLPGSADPEHRQRDLHQPARGHRHGPQSHRFDHAGRGGHQHRRTHGQRRRQRLRRQRQRELPRVVAAVEQGHRRHVAAGHGR